MCTLGLGGIWAKPPFPQQNGVVPRVKELQRHAGLKFGQARRGQAGEFIL
jgi:hypothetical protein